MLSLQDDARLRSAGVDPAHKELYLSDDNFEELFHMNKDKFTSLPRWKQQNMKKQIGLF
jgi:hypothetical protein